jgi:hypothetical protein
MNIADKKIHLVVYQKSDIHGNSYFQNYQKLDPIQITAKKFRPKCASLSKIFWCNKLTHGALKGRIRYTYANWFVW